MSMFYDSLGTYNASLHSKIYSIFCLFFYLVCYTPITQTCQTLKQFFESLYLLLHRKRLAFALEQWNWTAEDWKHVIWSDESKVNRIESDGCEYVWKRQKEPLGDRLVREKSSLEEDPSWYRVEWRGSSCCG